MYVCMYACMYVCMYVPIVIVVLCSLEVLLLSNPRSELITIEHVFSDSLQLVLTMSLH